MLLGAFDFPRFYLYKPACLSIGIEQAQPFCLMKKVKKYTLDQFRCLEIVKTKLKKVKGGEEIVIEDNTDF